MENHKPAMPGDTGRKYKLQDIIDLEHFQNLQDRLNDIYSFPSAIIDNEGNILTATAWQDICTKFHRVNERSMRECIKSDSYIQDHLHEADPAVTYRCPHGLVDNAAPIIIDGVHYANFFTGQFFLEKPDLEHFRKQARTYGFVEDAYIAAVEKVPVWTLDQLNSYLFFIEGIITILTESGLRNLRDIEARKELQESEKRYRDLFEKGNEGLLIMTTEGTVVEVNETFANMHGYTVEEIKKLNISDLDVLREDSISAREDIVARMAAGETVRFEGLHCHKDGHRFPVNITTSIIELGGKRHFFAYHQDITERKRIEETLRKTQKLESLGILAGGIAHDFNNLLGGIFGNIDLALSKTENSLAAGYLAKAMGSMERARDLTQQLLTFSKGGAPVKNVDSLFPFVEETARFVLSGSNVSCSFDVPDDLWPCDFDRNQIGQVVDNIVINAQQAMPGGGSIDISARNRTLAEKQHGALPAGRYVVVSVKDRGIGIPEDTLTHIFDPFYTTKQKGHGLGLSTCYSIVNQHGGCIDVASEPGRGSTFDVYLPAVAGTVAAAAETSPAAFTGSGTFLVMDDEEVVRTMVGDMLASLGYAVVLTENGEDAVALFAAEMKAGRPVAGMIFDLTVPGGMGGREAVGEIRKLCTRTPVFVASGYADDPVLANPGEYGFSASIGKPFSKTELVNMLNENIGQ